MILVIYYILINLLAFSLFGIDKSRARKGQWRIKESTLLLVSAWGGCFGGFLGMRTFSHKTRKAKFTLSMPLFILVHGVIIYLCLL